MSKIDLRAVVICLVLILPTGYWIQSPEASGRNLDISERKPALPENISPRDALIEKGHLLLSKGELKQAKRIFESAVKLGLKAEGYNGIGLIYWKTEKARRKCLPLFRRALHADPSLVDAQYNLARAYELFRPMEAFEAYEKVLVIDPQHHDAHYRIGLMLENEGKHHEASLAFQKQVTVRPNHIEAKYRLSNLLLASGQLRRAVRIYGELMSAGGEVEIWAYRQMAILNQLTHRYQQAEWLFEAYIDRLPTLEQELYRDIATVASREDAERWRGLTDTQKTQSLQRFWNSQDPAPLTSANERRIEHYRRIAYARAQFGQTSFPWDARGDVYVRLGHPDHTSASNNIRLERDPRIKTARLSFSNRMRSTASEAEDRPVDSPGRPSFPVQKGPWEYWVYSDIFNGTEFTFVDEFSSGNCSFAPVPLGLSPSRSAELMAFHGDVILRNVTADQPSYYKSRLADLPIDVDTGTAGFRQEVGKTRLEVYLGLPASESVRLSAREDSGLLMLDRGIVIHDSLWKEVYREEDQILLSPPTEQQILDRAFLPHILHAELAPGLYQLTYQIRDAVTGRSRVHRDRIQLEDYADRDVLKLSDIQLAFSISPTRSATPFVKDDLEIIPMPSRTFRRDQRAYVYFEIYNLSRDEFGQARYRVEYKLRSLPTGSAPARLIKGLSRAFGPGPGNQEIVITYDQVADDTQAIAHVELGLSATDPGRQLLEISVTDLATHQVATRDLGFRIVP